MLEDYRRAPIREPLRATLAFLEKLTLHPGDVGPDDAAAPRALGVSDEALRDAVYVCTLFNTIDRVADSLDFALLSEAGYESGADFLLKNGYAWGRR